MQLVGRYPGEPQTGKWQFADDVLLIHTDGRRDVVRHRLVSMNARKATFDPSYPFTLSRVR